MEWTDEKITALAPNDSTERRGRTLANSSKWNYLATNYEAIWGECKGSGSQPYLVQINLKGPKYKCSCPVRKPPCKHVLGLFFLFAKSSAVFKYQAPPEAVQNWLSRHNSPTVSTTKTTKTSSLIKTDQELEKAKQAKEKRWQQRVQLMSSGMDELELWLTDVVRQGIANVEVQKASFWNHTAAKMMDAKLPRISTYLKETHQIVLQHQNWSEQVVARLGELYLWIEAFKKRANLSPDLQEELYRMLGKTVKKADVIENNPAIKDNWLVIGKKEGVDIEGRNFRRVWLQGQSTDKKALILDYAFGHIGYEHQYIVGDLLKGQLAYYSSLCPQRAVFAHFESAPLHQSIEFKTYANVNELLNQYSQTIAKSPWLSIFPVGLSNLHAFIDEDQQLQLKDDQNFILPLAPIEEHIIWKILAISGGHSIDLFGEWNGLVFTPLSMLSSRGIIPFS
ncbi:SWIM zinc finger family protein [Aureispira anguillae]|uniref:SWIM zinc finger domain-containing protein n=1 Tax=Aureispira anguillae TaxID=2864201 RepID=A0A916DSU8_9BACT|nr:SWIM zinc finger family protein [Aureispira anguillae]BDS11051.1 SWIM zinc finger domain-containing protein [Aureispira anguillae]